MVKNAWKLRYRKLISSRISPIVECANLRMLGKKLLEILEIREFPVLYKFPSDEYLTGGAQKWVEVG